MGNFTEANISYTNFITPPDSIDDKLHTVLLIDVSETDVQKLALWCKSAQQSYNVYLYNSEMSDVDWLFKFTGQADAMIINTAPTGLDSLKENLLSSHKCFYYGPTKLDRNPRAINNPIEYFQQYEESIK